MRAAQKTKNNLQYKWPKNNTIEYTGGTGKPVSKGGKGANYLVGKNGYADEKSLSGNWKMPRGSAATQMSAHQFWGSTPAPNSDKAYQEAQRRSG